MRSSFGWRFLCKILLLFAARSAGGSPHEDMMFPARKSSSSCSLLTCLVFIFINHQMLSGDHHSEALSSDGPNRTLLFLVATNVSTWRGAGRVSWPRSAPHDHGLIHSWYPGLHALIQQGFTSRINLQKSGVPLTLVRDYLQSLFWSVSPDRLGFISALNVSHSDDRGRAAHLQPHRASVTRLNCTPCWLNHSMATVCRSLAPEPCPHSKHTHTDPFSLRHQFTSAILIRSFRFQGAGVRC